MTMKQLLFITFTILSTFLVSAQAPISVLKGPPIDYNVVELQPEYPGGNNEFIKYIGKNFVTPEVEGLSGILKVSFVIEINGKIADIKIINDLGSGTAEEAKRVLLKALTWIPGQQDGKPVRVLFNLPITIRGY